MMYLLYYRELKSNIILCCKYFFVILFIEEIFNMFVFFIWYLFILSFDVFLFYLFVVNEV